MNIENPAPVPVDVWCRSCTRVSVGAFHGEAYCQRHLQARVILAYRADHRIEPHYGYRGRWMCTTCGIDIYAIKDGWRHDPTLIRKMESPAGWTEAELRLAWGDR